MPSTYPPPWIEYTQGSGPATAFGRCTRTTTRGSSLTTWSVRSTVVGELDLHGDDAGVAQLGQRVDRELERGRELEQRHDLLVEDHGIHG